MATTARVRGNRRDLRRDDLRDRLLAAVAEMTADGESYTNLSVSRLVSAAGLSRATFYAYFEDKGDLVRAWFAQITEEMQSAADPWWELGADSTKVDLREALAGIVTRYRPHTTLMAAVYDATSYDATVREEVAAMMTNNIASLRSHVKKGQREGWIDPRLLPDETAAWLMWLAERGLHQLVRTASDEEVDTQIDAYTDIVWNTLYAFAPSRRA
ncbi:MAG: TetR/AcrR family transcriptional regulator [Dehalococcoidia bacterium]